MLAEHPHARLLGQAVPVQVRLIEAHDLASVCRRLLAEPSQVELPVRLALRADPGHMRALEQALLKLRGAGLHAAAPAHHRVNLGRRILSELTTTELGPREVALDAAPGHELCDRVGGHRVLAALALPVWAPDKLVQHLLHARRPLVPAGALPLHSLHAELAREALATKCLGVALHHQQMLFRVRRRRRIRLLLGRALLVRRIEIHRHFRRRAGQLLRRVAVVRRADARGPPAHFGRVLPGLVLPA